MDTVYILPFYHMFILTLSPASNSVKSIHLVAWVYQRGLRKGDFCLTTIVFYRNSKLGCASVNTQSSSSELPLVPACLLTAWCILEAVDCMVYNLFP